MKKLIILLVVCVTLMNGNCIPIKAEEAKSQETISYTQKIDGYEYNLNFDVNQNIATSTVKDYNGNKIAQYIRKDNLIYSSINGVLTIVATIEESLIASPYSISARATEKWGSVLTKKITVSTPNASSTVGAAIVSLCFLAFPPAYGAIATISTAIIALWDAEHPKKISLAYTYSEYSGCAKYKKYISQILFNTNGTVKKTAKLEKKEFEGVRNSPENPPICRELGF